MLWEMSVNTYLWRVLGFLDYGSPRSPEAFLCQPHLFLGWVSRSACALAFLLFLQWDEETSCSTLPYLATYTNEITVGGSHKCNAPWTIWGNAAHLLDATVHGAGDNPASRIVVCFLSWAWGQNTLNSHCLVTSPFSLSP